MIYDYDGASGSASDIGIVATQLLDSPYATVPVDLNNDQIKLIKKKYKINIIVAITVKDKNDVLIYNNYKNVADIFLFDSKGYEKSMSFDHKLIKDLRSNTEIMLAGNIQIDDDLESFNKIADIIDISGGLETAGLKDVSKINIFLNKIKQIKNET